MLRPFLKNWKAYSLERPPSFQIKLNQNESPYDLPDPLKKKILEKISSLDWNRYPTPFTDDLRTALAKNENWDPDGILVSPGSNVMIQWLMLATAIQGKVMTLKPSFSLYRVAGGLLENRVIEIPLSEEDFSLPHEEVIGRLEKESPQILLMANPNAPTGNLFPEESLLEILKVAKKRDCVVLLDEAYYPFSGITFKDHLRDFKNLIVLRTFSKAFSLGGIRLGYLIADPSLCQEIRKAMLPFTVGLLQETIGMTVLENAGYVDRLVEEIKKERELLFRGLQEIPGITPYRSSTNFILFRLPDANKTYQDLISEGILIRPMHGEGLHDCLRVTVGKAEENRLFLQRLRKQLA